MKRKGKDFGKFSARSTLKKRDRDKRIKNEIQRALDGTGISTAGAKIRISEDSGYHARRAGTRFSCEGIFSGTASGFGFVRVNGMERDIFIPEEYVRGAIDGDRVAVSYRSFNSYSGEERTEGRVEEILEFGRVYVIATAYCETARMHRRRVRRLFALADDGKLKNKIYLTSDEGISEGDKLQIKLLRKRNSSGYLEGEPLMNFGQSLSMEANYEAILAECGILTEFTDEELYEAERAARAAISTEGRVMRDEVILTIDGADAKDLDDAVSLKKTSDGWLLGVHIADVSHYVREKTALDRLAMARATSVYFIDKVVPMLPEALSNGACSLNAGEKKYTLSAIISLTRTGEISSLSIEPSIIESAIRGVYSEVNAIFDGSADTALMEKYAPCIDTLRDMRKLYLLLLKNSERRGALTLDAPEAAIIMNNAGEPVDIVRRERGDAEKMIEQFMLTANEAVARELSARGIPAVYRIHEPPPEDKMDKFIEYAHTLGFDTSFISKEKTDSRDLCRLLDEASKRGISEAVSYSMLRAMSKAEYSEIRSRHYGLALEYYCHFTSPIRRLSDLATHRIIKDVLLGERPAERMRGYAKRAAKAATDGEIRAEEAERRIENLYKVIYMSDKIGERFSGIVSSVTSFGMFVSLPNTCEGLVPLSELGAEFFFNEKTLSLSSMRASYKIGDKVSVILEEADIVRGKLRFSICSGENA